MKLVDAHRLQSGRPLPGAPAARLPTTTTTTTTTRPAAAALDASRASLSPATPSTAGITRVLGGAAVARSTPTAAVLVRTVAAASGDVLAGIEALLQRPEPSALQERLQQFLARTVRVDFNSAKDPARARDAALFAGLLCALRPLLDERSALDLAKLRTEAGPGGAALCAALEAAAARPLDARARTNFHFLSDTVQLLGAALGGPDALVVANAFLRDDALLPRTLAPLEAVKQMVPEGRFRDEGVVAVQHLFPTALPLFEALIEKGMDPRRIFVLGTPYGSNPLVLAMLRLHGVEALPGRDRMGATSVFEEERNVDIHEWLMRNQTKLWNARPPGGYTMLDDGGLLQLAAGGQKLPQSMPDDIRADWADFLSRLFPPGARAVEQTTRGLTELTTHGGPRYATVSVASCDAKKLEGEVIGHALVDGLLTSLAQRDLHDAKNITVVSAGTVGLQSARALRELGFVVTLVDVDAGKRAKAEAEGFAVRPALAPDLVADSDVILSCTGRTAVSGHELLGFRGLLVSGSSMAIELDARQVHSYADEPIAIANQGRPINFDGTGHENLSKEQIGVTRAILFAALAQKVDTRTVGFVDVDRAMQDAAVATWQPGTPPVQQWPPRDMRPRPDTIGKGGGARHDEWLHYLAGLRRPQCPRLTEHARAAAPVFFEDEQGQVRLVNTRIDGRSQPVRLPSVPVDVRVCGNEPDAAILALCRDPDGDGLVLFRVEQGATPRVHAHGAVDGVGTSLIEVVDRDANRWVNRRMHGSAFVSGDSALVFRGDHRRAERIKLPPGIEPGKASLQYVNESALLVLQRGDDDGPPRAEILSLADDALSRHARAQLRVPDALATIEATAVWDDMRIMAFPVIAFGRTHEGKRVCTALVPACNPPALVELPVDATLRGLRACADDPAALEVLYTLPGDVVESRHLRSVKVPAAMTPRT